MRSFHLPPPNWAARGCIYLQAYWNDAIFITLLKYHTWKAVWSFWAWHTDTALERVIYFLLFGPPNNLLLCRNPPEGALPGMFEDLMGRHRGIKCSWWQTSWRKSNLNWCKVWKITTGNHSVHIKTQKMVRVPLPLSSTSNFTLTPNKETSELVMPNCTNNKHVVFISVIKRICHRQTNCLDL